MEFNEHSQIFSSSLLDLKESGLQPLYIGPYQIGNVVQRSLAHLAGTDGTYTHLIRCNSSGQLQVTISGGTPLDTLHTDLATLHTDSATLHTDLGTTIHGDLGTLHTDSATLHTDLGTTIHGDLGTLHTDLATGIHSDLDLLHTDLNAVIHGDLYSLDALLTAIADILTDVYDGTAHRLKVALPS